MADTQQLLKDLPDGKTKKIGNKSITKSGEFFIYDGDSYTLSQLLDIIGYSEQATGFDYSSLAFVEKKRYSTAIIKIHKARNKHEHTKLVDEVIERGNVLWYGKVISNENDEYIVNQPLLIDFDTLEIKIQQSLICKNCKREFTTSSGLTLHAKSCVVEPDENFDCPICNAKIKSASGRTLHIKSKHPEHFEKHAESNK